MVVTCDDQAAVQRGPPAMTRPDRLEEAAAYIRQTTERVERLKERKRELMASARASPSHQGSGSGSSVAAAEVEVQHLGSGLHAILVTGAPPSEGASFHRAVRAVEEAGGEVQNAHFSVVGARAIYTIHTLVSRRLARLVSSIKLVFCTHVHATHWIETLIILYCSFNFSDIQPSRHDFFFDFANFVPSK